MPIINTREEYRNLNALNQSGAKVLLTKTPAGFKAYLEAESKDTKALRMGSLTHAMVLEKDTVLQRYVASPLCDRRTKDGKQLYDAFQIANADKTIVASDEWEVCDKVAASMNERIKSLGLTITTTELMISVEYNGAMLKAALDAIVTDKNGDEWIVDLKTTAEEGASPKEFLQTVRNYRLALQAHWYRTVYQMHTGKRVRGFIFIVAEKAPPYLSAAYQIGPELMTYAAFDFEAVITLYKGCIALDEWPGYPNEVVELDIPSKNTSNPISFA